MEDYKEDFKFTEEYIQKKLDGFFAESTKKYVLENLYIFNWESDKFIETRSGLIYEFEIKISRSDFKNDFKNKKNKHLILEGKEEQKKRPNYFYYAVPKGLITLEDVPEYAGLIYIIPDDGEYHFTWFQIIKQAPKLHDKKYSDDDLNLGEKFYYNMLSWKDKCSKMNEKLLLSEGIGHKIPYVDLVEKCEKLKKENKSLKNIAVQKEEIINSLNTLIYENNKIIRAYRKKIKEYEKDFKNLDFEEKLFKE